MTSFSTLARLSLVAFLLALLSACDKTESTSSETPHAGGLYQVPRQTGDGWQVASLSSQGIDETAIREMLDRTHAGDFPGVSSARIVRNGFLVLDAYFGEFDRDDLHSTRSAAKAVTSALVGIAIDAGYVDSVNAKLLPFFPEYEGEIQNWDARKREITLAHILSMTSGVRGNEDAMYPTDDWIKFYLDQPLVAEPGETFSYATSGVVTLGSVVSRASGLSVPDFADRYLFGPLGIDSYRWPITNSRATRASL